MNALIERLTSLRFRLIIGFAVAGILISSLALSLSYLRARSDLFREKQHKLSAIVANAALQIDGDAHAQLQTAADMQTETYRALQNKAFAIAATDPEILYVYTMRKNQDGKIYFVLDAGHEPGAAAEQYQPVEIGTLYEKPSALLIENFKDINAPIVEPVFYTDEFGTYLTAYAPLYRSDGQFEGIVAVDILAQDILAQQRLFLRDLLLLLLVSAGSAVVLGLLAGNQIADPVLKLAQRTAAIKGSGESLNLQTGIREINAVIESFNNLLFTLRADEEKLRQQAAALMAQNTEIQQTADLLEKRAGQLEIIAEIIRTTTAIQNLQSLLPHIAATISERLGYYHVGIFLIDENREYAVLRAANSPGGQRMLARKHKLKVGQTGIVGYVTAVGAPRVALDVGADAVYFNNPDLPQTRSEIALPLVIGEQIIGALDVQSTEPNAFQTEDINLLKILADQIAIAIYNARIYETMEEVFERSQKTTSASLQDAWRILQSDGAKIGYMASAEGIAPVQRPWMTPYNRKALVEKQTVAESGINAALAVPIRLRGEVIGVLDIHTRSEHEWDEDEVDIAEAVADRLSLALETALLLKATQRRAEIERITTDIAGKITATTQIDTILRTAAEELSRILGGSEVLVQLHTDMADSPTKEK